MSIEDDFPPVDPQIPPHHYAAAYAELRSRAVEMEEQQQKIRDYYRTCERAYSSRPTDYERGVLQGIECAIAFLPLPPAPNHQQTK